VDQHGTTMAMWSKAVLLSGLPRPFQSPSLVTGGHEFELEIKLVCLCIDARLYGDMTHSALKRKILFFLGSVTINPLSIMLICDNFSFLKQTQIFVHTLLETWCYPCRMQVYYCFCLRLEMLILFIVF